MIDNINPERVHDLIGSVQPQNRSAVSRSGEDVDISIDMSFDSLVDQALQEPRISDDDVRIARELLLSGRIETPQGIRAAAKNILELGA